MADFDTFYNPSAVGTMSAPTQAPAGQRLSGGVNIGVSGNLGADKLPVFATVLLFGLVLLGMHARE